MAIWFKISWIIWFQFWPFEATAKMWSWVFFSSLLWATFCWMFHRPCGNLETNFECACMRSKSSNNSNGRHVCMACFVYRSLCLRLFCVFLESGVRQVCSQLCFFHFYNSFYIIYKYISIHIYIIHCIHSLIWKCIHNTQFCLSQ